MKIIGLTGISGSGKSEVANILRSLGGFIIDCDLIAHNNMAVGGASYDEIVDNFGTSILREDKSIDRKILGNIVFNDKYSLQKLNQITHKHITNAINICIEDIKKNVGEYKYIVIDAPLLFEAGIDTIVDCVWVVTASIETRINRLTIRDGIAREAVVKRLENQKSDEEMLKLANVVIYNDGDSLEKLKKEVISKFKE